MSGTNRFSLLGKRESRAFVPAFWGHSMPAWEPASEGATSQGLWPHCDAPAPGSMGSWASLSC